MQHLQKIARHYKWVKMAFFICFRSILAVLAAIWKCLYLVYAMHIVSFKYLPVAWALIYGKKDGIQYNQHRTRKYCVFNHSSAAFRGKNCNLSNYQIQYKILHILSCTIMLFSTDWFRKILLIVRSCMIFGRFCKNAKSRNSRRPAIIAFSAPYTVLLTSE